MPKTGQHIKPRTLPNPPAIHGARWIPLTKGMFALVDEEDYQELSRYSWVYAWQGYAFRKAPVGEVPKQIRMHRQIIGVTDPKVLVDHRHGNGLDNRRKELRVATLIQNNRNNQGRSVRKGPFKGVCPSGRISKPWIARITVNSKTLNLGRFTLSQEAARAYDRAAITHFGEFARLNFDSEGRGEIRASKEFFE